MSTIPGFRRPITQKMLRAIVQEGTRTFCREARKTIILLLEEKEENHSQTVTSNILNCAATPGRLVIPKIKDGVERPWTENIIEREIKASDRILTFIFLSLLPAIPTKIAIPEARMDTTETI
ncbi:hypothetical protein [Neobacillus piezotolerans]|uniref:hypothetical protein n=1 Tax=Neobacillus piezotolerans TaxID=2259171 RepID=UPI001FE4DD78|nr:hypothetical protein [Neobacillus piezotolerans]